MTFPFRSALELRHRTEELRACRHRFRRTAFAGVFLFAVAVLFFIRLAAIGLPHAWVERISDALSSEATYVELDRVSFVLSRMRLHVGSTRVFLKGSVDDPILSIKDLSIRIRPRFKRFSVDWIKSVRMGMVSVSIPEDDFGNDGDSGFSAEDLSFPPIPIDCRTAKAYGLTIRGLRGTVACRAGNLRLTVDRCLFSDPGEPFEQAMEGVADIPLLDGAYGARGSGVLDPNRLAPLLREVDAEYVTDELRDFEFSAQPPRVDIDFRYDPDRFIRDLVVAVEAGPSSYRHVPLQGFSGKVHLTGSNRWDRLVVDPLHIVRPEGVADGQLDLLTREHVLKFQGTSRIDPVHVLEIARVLDAGEGEGIVVDNPTVLTSDGVFAFGSNNWQQTSVRLSVMSPGLSIAGVHLEDVHANGTIVSNQLSFPRIEAGLLGGSFASSLRLNIPNDEQPDSRLALDATVTGMSYGRFNGQFIDPGNEDVPGSIDMSLAFDGPFDDISSGSFLQTDGTLSVAIRRARLFGIPFFSRLNDIISATIPGVDELLNQDDLKASGTFSRGRLDLSNLELIGGAVTITGSGSIWRDQSIELGIKVHLMNKETWVGNVVYHALSPISSIFAFKASGTVGETKWSSAPLSIGTDSRRKAEDLDRQKETP